ncbi:NAD-dependent epimerase/dehydratase family protein [Alsobacter sp. R-9]
MTHAVLVTGAGVVGRLTAEALAARGDAVVLVDVRKPDRDLRSGIAFAICDVADADALGDVVARHGCRSIIHTAAVLSTGIRQDPVRGVAVNVLGTANVLDVARRCGVGRVVLASSTTVGYTTFARGGDHADGVREDLALRIVSERPASIYAATKLCGEHLGLLYADLYGVDTVILRYGAVLGGDLDRPTSVPGRLLARLVEGARRGETVVLDDPYLAWGGMEEFVDARDCAGANVHALDASSPRQRVYNVGTGEAVTLASFIAIVRQAHPSLDVMYPGEPSTGFAGFPHRRPAPSNVDAARSELGFACRHDLADTIRHWTGAEQP